MQAVTGTAETRLPAQSADLIVISYCCSQSLAWMLHIYERFMSYTSFYDCFLHSFIDRSILINIETAIISLNSVN
jgi:hypothetical protein